MAEEIRRDKAKMFRSIDTNNDTLVTKKEWSDAFSNLDVKADGVISRKQWYLFHGTTKVFDAVSKQNRNSIRKQEWLEAFDALDLDKNGYIDSSELEKLDQQPGSLPKPTILGWNNLLWS